jgi:hypothetical protein
MNRKRGCTVIGVLIALVWIASSAAHDDPPPKDDGPRAASDPSAGDRTTLRNEVSIEIRDGYRYITANGIPNHPTGRFPNRGNPNAIRPQHYRFRVPLHPQPANRTTSADGQPFGVALNGVVFDPGTAEWWKDDASLGWRIEAIGGTRGLGLDGSRAHVQPNGAYHYHGIPTALLQQLAQHSDGDGKNGEPAAAGMILVGWAADGFPIYGPNGYVDPKDSGSALARLRSSYRLKQGKRPNEPDAPGGDYDGAYTQDWAFVAGAGDLDECNGRFGVTPEFRDGTYYYVLTDDFPFVPRFFRGTPDVSFARRPPGAGPGAPRRRLPDQGYRPRPRDRGERWP